MALLDTILEMPNNTHKNRRNTRNACIYRGEHLSILLREIVNNTYYDSSNPSKIKNARQENTCVIVPSSVSHIEYVNSLHQKAQGTGTTCTVHTRSLNVDMLPL